MDTSISKLKAAQVADNVRSDIAEGAKKIDEFIASSARAYREGKSSIEQIRADFKQKLEEYSHEYETDQYTVNIMQSRAKEELGYDRITYLATQRKLSQLAKQPDVQQYIVQTRSLAKQISELTSQMSHTKNPKKIAELQMKIDEKQNEIDSYKEEFSQKPIAAEYIDTVQTLSESRQRVKDGKEKIKELKKSEKSMAHEYREGKKAFSVNEHTEIAEVRKQNRLQKMIGFIRDKLGSKKRNNNEVIRLLQYKLGELAQRVPELKEKLEDIQISALLQLTSMDIKREQSKSKLRENIQQMKDSISRGIVGVITRISTARNNAINSVSDLLADKIDSKQHTISDLQANRG